MLIQSLFIKKRINMFLQEYDLLYRNMESRAGNLKDESSLLSDIDQLIAFSKNASYFVIVTVLLMGLYNRLFKTILRRYQIEISTINIKKDTTILEDIVPNYYLKKLHSLYETLSNDEKEKFQYGTATEKEGSGAFQEMLEEFSKFLKNFGHLSESGNDFSKIQWKEKPELIRSMIINFRNMPRKAGGDGEISLSDLPRNPLLRFLYRNALEYQEYRERVNYLYTYGYSLFRQHFLGLSSLWRANNYITMEDDIFYLAYEEIIEFHQNRLSLEMVLERIAHRRGEMLRFQNLHLPSIIVGDSLPPEIPVGKISKILRGVPASKGYCSGKIHLIKVIEDFPKAKEGDILVIPYSDVSWTPLFIRAKGVISESGGMLSHSSIMAREYGIPAVVSVPEAMNLIDGTLVALDGDKGEVLILE
jgi:phosphohistidine swiveling domain-containing protein